MRRKGFTLIELSIVLVIIGLLVGGVLKGKAMIENAKQKRLKTDIDGVMAAVYSYQDKFGYLPGDDPKDRSIELGATGCTAGIGDGDGLFDAAEVACIWQEMAGAGFISGNPADNNGTTAAKRSPYGGSYEFVNGANGNKTGNYLSISSMPSDIVKVLDEKYDDGVFNTGDIQTALAYPVPPAAPTSIAMYWYAF